MPDGGPVVAAGLVPLELERKFLIRELPSALGESPAQAIEQGYVVIGTDGSEVRLRRRSDRCYLTVKSGGGMVRREVEVELGAEQFDALWPLTEGRRVEKVRHLLDGGEGLVIELDRYSGELAGLLVAEVEFGDADAARAFVPPVWFGQEVTDDDRYKNRRLAVDGAPSGN